MLGLGSILEMTATALPHRSALTFEGETLSYEGLHRLAQDWRATLAGAQVRRAMAIGENHPGMVGLLFGAMMAGCDLSLANPRLKQAEVEHALELTEPDVIFTWGVRSDAPTKAVRRFGRSVVLQVRDTVPPKLAGLANEQLQQVDPQDARLLIFTSGTTSLPKAVILRQESVAQYLMNSYEPLSAPERDASLVAVPLFHIGGLMNVLSAVYAARRTVLLRRFDSRAWLEAIRSEAVTHAFVVPVMLRQLVARLRESRDSPPPSLKMISYGGSPIRAEDIRAAIEGFPGVELVGAFGLTETSSTVSVLTPDDHRVALEDPEAAQILSSVGRPIPGVEIIVSAPESSTPLGQGEVGEVLIRGPQVSQGYIGAPSPVDQDGWLHTGDLGRFDERGYLYLVGRVDDMIQRGAENVSPLEVEAALARNPRVTDLVALAVPDAEWGEVVGLAVVAENARDLESLESELRELASEQLAAHKRPAHYAFVEAIPQNALGKALRAELRQAFRATVE